MDSSQECDEIVIDSPQLSLSPLSCTNSHTQIHYMPHFTLLPLELFNANLWVNNFNWSSEKTSYVICKQQPYSGGSVPLSNVSLFVVWTWSPEEGGGGGASLSRLFRRSDRTQHSHCHWWFFQYMSSANLLRPPYTPLPPHPLALAVFMPYARSG